MSELTKGQVSQILGVIERLETEARSGAEIDAAVASVAHLLFDERVPRTTDPNEVAAALQARAVAVTINTTPAGAWAAMHVPGGSDAREFSAADLGLTLAGLDLQVALYERCPVDILDLLSDPTAEEVEA